MHGHFGVRITGEFDTGRLQLGAQYREVLDDPVMDHRDLAGGILMRVRVAIGGGAVRGPAGVSHPGRRGERFPDSAIADSRFASRPALRCTSSPPLPSASATPAES